MFDGFEVREHVQSIVDEVGDTEAYAHRGLVAALPHEMQIAGWNPGAAEEVVVGKPLARAGRRPGRCRAISNAVVTESESESA